MMQRKETPRKFDRGEKIGVEDADRCQKAEPAVTKYLRQHFHIENSRAGTQTVTDILAPGWTEGAGLSHDVVIGSRPRIRGVADPIKVLRGSYARGGSFLPPMASCRSIESRRNNERAEKRKGLWMGTSFNFTTESLKTSREKSEPHWKEQSTMKATQTHKTGRHRCMNRTPQLGGGGYFFFFTRRRVPGVPRVNSEGGQGAAATVLQDREQLAGSFAKVLTTAPVQTPLGPPFKSSTSGETQTGTHPMRYHPAGAIEWKPRERGK
ncbi:hypothetical protein B0H13DRAFT_1881458 [Mycena leptocephala]|nr:hypothetical protein B0H13DRAFT_1881458 [Mycena leptocephala]